MLGDMFEGRWKGVEEGKDVKIGLTDNIAWKDWK